MKKLYIGDIHGNIEAVRRIRDTYKEDYHKIFVGDLVDKKFLEATPEDQYQCVKLVLEMITVDRDTDCLVGNHEIGYLLRDIYPCSGFSVELDRLLEPIKEHIWNRFKSFIYNKDQKLLVTHAGLTRRLWEDGNLTFNNLEHDLAIWAAPPYHRQFYNIGRARGRADAVGGPLWCDWDDEFEPVDGLTQIFGHTPDETTSGIRTRDNNYNIDCTHHGKILLEEEGEFREIETGDRA